MLKNSILSGSGQPLVLLGGEHVWKQRVTGDIVSEYKWLDGEPVMILYRAVPTTKTGAFVIEVADAHKYADSETGGPSKTLVWDCMRAARAIGFSPTDKFAVHRIADVILDGLEDLVRMPSEAPQEQQKQEQPSGAGELSIQIDGQTVMEAAV